MAVATHDGSLFAQRSQVRDRLCEALIFDELITSSGPPHSIPVSASGQVGRIGFWIRLDPLIEVRRVGGGGRYPTFDVSGRG